MPNITSLEEAFRQQSPSQSCCLYLVFQVFPNPHFFKINLSEEMARLRPSSLVPDVMNALGGKSEMLSSEASLEPSLGDEGSRWCCSTVRGPVLMAGVCRALL